jgi:hypothetical protein
MIYVSGRRSAASVLIEPAETLVGLGRPSP